MVKHDLPTAQMMSAMLIHAGLGGIDSANLPAGAIPGIARFDDYSGGDCGAYFANPAEASLLVFIGRKVDRKLPREKATVEDVFERSKALASGHRTLRGKSVFDPRRGYPRQEDRNPDSGDRSQTRLGPISAPGLERVA